MSSWLSSEGLKDCMLYWSMIFIERFEDPKVVIRSRKSKDRQCNGQNETNTKGQTMIYKTLHTNLRAILYKGHSGCSGLYHRFSQNFASKNLIQ